MSIYDLALSLGAAASNAPYVAILSGTRTVKVRRLRIVLATGVATTIGLCVPNAGTAPVATVTTAPTRRDPSDRAPLALAQTAWSTSPALPGAPIPYSAQDIIGGVVGNGLVWPFDDAPIVIPPSGLLALFNIGAGAGAALSLNVAIEE